MLDAALQYAARGWRVFPLHTTISGRCSCGKVGCTDAGKHPRTKHGVKDATTDPATIERWWTKWPDANIAIATGSGLIVTDIDGPTGVEQLAALAAPGGLAETLVARTGRGIHVYHAGELVGSKKRGELLIRGEGGYVVAPPSLHVSGVRYQWVKEVPLAPLPDCIRQLVESVGGKAQSEALGVLGPLPSYLAGSSRKVSYKALQSLATPWSAHEQARIESALAAIPASCQREPWLRVGMALHALGWSGGPDGIDLGFTLWDRWSATCPDKYSEFDVETRWRSFGKQSGVTIGSLYHLAEQCGWTGMAPRAAPEMREEVMPPGESANILPTENGANREHLEVPDSPHDIARTPENIGMNGTKLNGTHALPAALTSPTQDSPLITLNEKYAAIGDVGGKCLVLGWVPSKVDEDLRVPSFQAFKAFQERYAHQYVVVPKPSKDGAGWTDEQQPLGAYWLKWKKRKSYDGIDLVPGAPQLLPGNVLNLWRGWAVEPARGSWERMKDHIARILARGEPESVDYIMRWAAWTVQHPAERAEVALVFRGNKGSGKGTFANALKKMFGQHGLQIFNSKHLVGSFNGHLRNCLLLFADEAFWAGDKQGESVLKGMLTEPALMIEQKGVDAAPWKNRLHVIMAANAEWVVPASHDERRYAMFDVSNERVGDRQYFDAIHRELTVEGGLAAMLWDLQQVDLGDWHPRQVVSTEALREQKARSLDPRHEWWESFLQEGRLPGLLKDRALTVPAGLLLTVARESTPKLRDLSAAALGRFLGGVGCRKIHTATGNAWTLPGLSEARGAWDARFGRWRWEDSGSSEWVGR